MAWFTRPPRLGTEAIIRGNASTNPSIGHFIARRARQWPEPSESWEKCIKPCATRASWTPPTSIDRKSTRLNSSHANIYTLSLHYALPISFHRAPGTAMAGAIRKLGEVHQAMRDAGFVDASNEYRSEEHTSELQSRQYLHSFPTLRSSDLISSRAGHGNGRSHPKAGRSASSHARRGLRGRLQRVSVAGPLWRARLPLVCSRAASGPAYPAALRRGANRHRGEPPALPAARGNARFSGIRSAPHGLVCHESAVRRADPVSLSRRLGKPAGHAACELRPSQYQRCEWTRSGFAGRGRRDERAVPEAVAFGEPALPAERVHSHR